MDVFISLFNDVSNSYYRDYFNQDIQKMFGEVKYFLWFP
jgi:hypothetical protein